LERLGCFAVVLEGVPSALAARITSALAIPTIGIGAGGGVSGQVLVLHDLTGYPVRADAKLPRFVRRYANARALVRDAAAAWAEDVRSGRFPSAKESFGGSAIAGAYGGAGAVAADSAVAKATEALRVFEDPGEWKRFCRSLSGRGTVGFVPTMGALHDGHASLVGRSASENDFTLVSIFVNPTQFNDPKDLAAYPRTVEADCALLAAAGATAVFLPTPDTMYPDTYAYRISENELSAKYCGAFRPGHFDGVLAVVMKLLQLAGADRAYFGEKDWQQYLLIRGMAEAFFLDTEIVPCPIVRESSGLAMSSRNTRLSAAGLDAAKAIYRAIAASPDTAAARAILEQDGFKVEYVEDRMDPKDGSVRRLAAAWLEGVRLIDNVPIGPDGRELRGGK
jgi:pantoate--beta-alanine ligase